MKIKNIFVPGSLLVLTSLIIGCGPAEENASPINVDPAMAADWQGKKEYTDYSDAISNKADKSTSETDPCDGFHVKINKKTKLKTVNLNVRRILMRGSYLLLKPISAKNKGVNFYTIGTVNAEGQVEYSEQGKTLIFGQKDPEGKFAALNVTNPHFTLIDNNTMTLSNSFTSAVAGKPATTKTEEETLVRVNAKRLAALRQGALECLASLK